MEKEAKESELPQNHVRARYRNPPNGSLEMSPERSNSSRKRKTASLSLFYPPPRPPLGTIKPSTKLEAGCLELKGDIPVRQGTCRCKQSCCLKMYCWCFASGKYCDGCSCFDCQNTAENEEARQTALGNILERNSKSLRKRIMKTLKFSLYNKEGGKENLILVNSVGCCCKRSHCIQGYCVCYHANMLCSETCKCKNCKNVKSYKTTSSNESKKSEDKENFLDLNWEDQLNCTLGQSWKIVRRTTLGPLNFSYRSLLADIIQLQNLMEFCKLLMVTSEAVKTDSRKPFDLENLGHEREVQDAVAFVDDQVEGQDYQGPRLGVHLSGVADDKLCHDCNSVDFILKERTMSQETVSLTCDEKDKLFTPDASSNGIQSSGYFSEDYMEQERLILMKFRDFLNCLVTCGNAKELELAARAKDKMKETIFSHKFVLQNLKRS